MAALRELMDLEDLQEVLVERGHQMGTPSR